MTKIDIFSGFLGAGKTTLIKKLIQEAYTGEKIVLIENEFGQLGIDGGFLKDAGIEITEMNSGCICCSLVGDFSQALQEVLSRFRPDRILIEPSGVGKLSDVAEAVQKADDAIAVNGLVAVVDAGKCKMYMKNFGEFFNNQIEHAKTIVFSHIAKCSPEKLAECIALVKEHNPHATIVTTDWDKLTGAQILVAMEQKNPLTAEMGEIEHHTHHHEHAHSEHCSCGHDHHHEHHHDEHCECGHDHHHEHHHSEHCDCGHEHHHAEEVFASVGIETAKPFTAEEIAAVLDKLNSGAYGTVLRAKGIVDSGTSEWIHFDFVPGEPDVRSGAADIIGRICVIGTQLHTDEIKALFE